MTHEVKIALIDAGEGISIGTILSTGMAGIWPETIHGLAVVATALVSATAIFFYNRFLRKKFPEK